MGNSITTLPQQVVHLHCEQFLHIPLLGIATLQFDHFAVPLQEMSDSIFFIPSQQVAEDISHIIL